MVQSSSKTSSAHFLAPICRNPACAKQFSPRRRWQVFCCSACRRAFHSQGSVAERLDDLERRIRSLEEKFR